MSGPLILLIAVVVILAALVGVFKACWRVAEPNEALIISGRKRDNPEGTAVSMGFRIVTGKGTLVLPGVEKVRKLSLDLHEADLLVECVTTQGIPLKIRAVVIYKVGDDMASIANAARRFLDKQEQMDARVHNVLSGHLRAIIGDMNVEDMIRDREQLTDKSREAAGLEFTKLGLIIDSLQIQEIDDPTGYIDQLRQPHAAKVESEARIASAAANQDATAREQEANAMNAQAERDTQIKQAGFQAEINKANAEAAQAGPLAEATARQSTVVQQTKIATLEAERSEQQLIATVVRPAEAAAKAQVLTANATRDASIANAEAEAARLKKVGEATADATKVTGLAEAAALQAKGEAEGVAIKARADALAANEAAVINQQFVERLPEIVAAIAAPISNVGSMTMLNGADDLTEMITGVISRAVSLRPLINAMMAGHEVVDVTTETTAKDEKTSVAAE